MSNYIIDRTNPSNMPIVVAPAGKKTQAGITWQGKYYTPWGESLNENLLRLSENFASDNEPSFLDDSNVSFNKLDGQLWFHTLDHHHTQRKILKVQNSNNDLNTNGWKRLELIITNNRPTFHTVGEQWYDPTDKTLSISRGNGRFDDLTVKKSLDTEAIGGISVLQFVRSDINATVLGTLSLSHIKPRIHNEFDNGLVNTRWRNTYTRNLVTNTSHSILPQEHNTFNLGNNDLRWKRIDVETIGSVRTENLIPTSNKEYTLGSEEFYYRSLYVEKIEGDIDFGGDLLFEIPAEYGEKSRGVAFYNNISKHSIYAASDEYSSNIYFDTTSPFDTAGYVFRSNLGNDILLINQDNILIRESELVIKSNIKLESRDTTNGCKMAYNGNTKSIEFIFYD